MSDPRSPRNLIAPTVGTGVLMAVYLLVRPYGDADGPAAAAAAAAAATAAFASTAWVVAHICGALALASFARLALRMSDLYGGARARAARTLALAGTVLVLPYYGAETFALHEIARRSSGDVDMALVEAIRNNAAAMTMFGLGLVMLAVAGLLIAAVWARHSERSGWALWPLGVLIALFLPQFFLTAELRIVYGIGYAIAAAIAVAAMGKTPTAPQESVTDDAASELAAN